MNSIEGDLRVKGRVIPDSFTTPNNSIGDAQVDGTRPITAPKLEHQFVKTYWQGRGAAVAAKTGEPVHLAYGAGTVVDVSAEVSVPGVTWTGNATVDLKKNGTSVLTAPITIDGTAAAFTPVVGGIAAAAYAADAVFEVVVTFAAGTGTPPQGLAVRLVLREAAAP